MNKKGELLAFFSFLIVIVIEVFTMQKNLNQNIVNLQDSIITEFAELAASIDGSLKLTFGQPDFNTPKVIKEAAKKQIDLNRTRYESARGNDLLINNITEYEKNHNNYSYSTDEVVITNGATGAIYIALCTLLNKDDEVIIPCPYYPEYEPVVTRCEAKVINYFNEQFDYQLDYDTLENLITPKTKCLILTSPNNPTGVILNDKSIEVAYKLVKKYNIYLLLDNCYEQLVYDKIANFSKYPDIKDYILICQSFSKPYAMTGWRLGYLLAPKYFIDAAVKLHQYLNVSITSFIQDAGVIALKYYPETSYTFSFEGHLEQLEFQRAQFWKY